jgi:protein SCO1/2
MRNNTPHLPAAALLASAVLVLAGCGGHGEGGGSAAVESAPSPVGAGAAGTGQRAVTVLDTPFTKPDLVATDTRGETFDLRARTKGRPTLVYFGYTHCPDVCPLVMSNIAVAKQRLPKAEQDKLRVVFVTTDPARDTPSELGSWLAAQDPAFTGLTGDFAATRAAARQLAISIEAPKKEKDGTIVSTHGTQVIAFSPKTDGGYLLFDENATVDDYTKDLPKIIEGVAP